MYPLFQRGDILILSNARGVPNLGDVCVFKLDDRSIPIVHRIIEKKERYVLALMGKSAFNFHCVEKA